MKFRITMKDPDAFYESVQSEDLAKGLADMPEDERDAVIDLRREKAREFSRRWMRYGEYFDVEFDTEAGTATLLETG